MDKPQCIQDILRSNNERTITYIHHDDSISRDSYSQFRERVFQLSHYLKHCGFVPGDVISVISPNSQTHYELIWGIIAAGCVYNGINNRISGDDIQYIVEHSQSKLIIVDDSLANHIVNDQVPRCLISEIQSVSLSGFPSQHAAVISAPSDNAVLCYTSGTTGKPKGVPYSHQQILAHIHAELPDTSYGVGSSQNSLLVVPFFHGAGWGLPFSSTFAQCNITILSGKLSAERVSSALLNNHIDITAAVPEVWEPVVSDWEKNDIRFPEGLRIVMGGVSPNDRLVKRLTLRGVVIIHVWGMTETLSACTANVITRAKGLDQYHQGYPLPISEISIKPLDTHCHSSSGHPIGEIYVRGKCVLERYYRYKQVATTIDGWLATGDIGWIDDNGALHFVERQKDLIKSGGEWIVPNKIEKYLTQHAAVSECAVVGVEHSKWGERPIAIIKTRLSVTTTEIQTHLDNYLPKWQCPDKIIFVDKIEKTSMGKINRKAIKSHYKHTLQTSQNDPMPVTVN